MAKQRWKAQSVSVRVGGRKDEEELFESSWSTAGFSVVHPSVLVSSNWCSRSHSSDLVSSLGPLQSGDYGLKDRKIWLLSIRRRRISISTFIHSPLESHF